MKKKLLHLMVYLGLLGIVSATLLGMHAEEILEPEIAQDPEIQELQKNVSQAQDTYKAQIAHMKKSIAENKNANIVNTLKNWFAKTDTNEPIAENTEKQLQEITNIFANKLVEADQKLKNAIANKRIQLENQSVFTEAMRPEPKPELTTVQSFENEMAKAKAKEAEAQAKASALAKKNAEIKRFRATARKNMQEDTTSNETPQELNLAQPAPPKKSLAPSNNISYPDIDALGIKILLLKEHLERIKNEIESEQIKNQINPNFLPKQNEMINNAEMDFKQLQDQVTKLAAQFRNSDLETIQEYLQNIKKHLETIKTNLTSIKSSNPANASWFSWLDNFIAWLQKGFSRNH